MNRHLLLLLTFLCISFSFRLLCQENEPELSLLIDKALRNNKDIESDRLHTEAVKASIDMAYDFPKTALYYSYDQNNVAVNGHRMKIFGLVQAFEFPTVYMAKEKLNKSLWRESVASHALSKNRLILNISMLYEQIVYIQNKEKLFTYLDSLYTGFARLSEEGYEAGTSLYLEKITARAKAQQLTTQLNQLKNEKQSAYEELGTLVQDDQRLTIYKDELEVLESIEMTSGLDLQMDYLNKVSDSYQSRLKLQKQSWAPDMALELWTASNKNLGYHRNGFKVTVALPLIFSGNLAGKKSAKLDKQSWESERDYREDRMYRYFLQKRAELNRYREVISYYNETGDALAKEIIQTAENSYRTGEIDFFRYIQSLEQAINIEVDYIDNVLAYNRAYLQLHFLDFND